MFLICFSKAFFSKIQTIIMALFLCWSLNASAVFGRLVTRIILATSIAAIFFLCFIIVCPRSFSGVILIIICCVNRVFGEIHAYLPLSRENPVFFYQHKKSSRIFSCRFKIYLFFRVLIRVFCSPYRTNAEIIMAYNVGADATLFSIHSSNMVIYEFSKRICCH